MAQAQGLIDYISAGPSPFHCVAETKRRLDAAGFVAWNDQNAPPKLNSGDGGYIIRSGSIIAWRVGSESPVEAGFRLLGAHTDSPNLRLKPNPDVTNEGYAQWAIEPYGGVLLATWTDRDLGLSGRVVLRDGTTRVSRLVRIDRPLARVANLAIHLNRQVNDKGLILNKQKHMPPIIGQTSDSSSNALRELIASDLGCTMESIVGWDLGLHDIQTPTIGGLNNEFIFSPRLDNQASCYMALSALLALDEVPRHTCVIALYDHEEVGSGSEQGAKSTLTRNLLGMLASAHPAHTTGGVERALANSFLVSADMAHGVHPNYADKSEPHHKPRLNGGPVIKTNVNMRYATDADTSARFRMACADEGVPVQEFVNRSDLACGGTIGAISASALAVRTVDVGNAMLSMHSIREQCGAHDVEMMTRVMTRILREG
jgi:aspartyl aminopeptidase